MPLPGKVPCWLRVLCLTLALSLLGGVTACRRGYKVGAAISAQDLTNALPEFVIALPPGATNLYLEHRPSKRVTWTWYKVTMPRTAMTNFLQSFGVLPEFMSVPPQMLALRKSLSRPPAFPSGVDGRSAAAWLSEMTQTSRRAAYWDLEKARVPLRMYLATRTGGISPRDLLFLSAYTDDTSAVQANIWIEYLRVRR